MDQSAFGKLKAYCTEKRKAADYLLADFCTKLPTTWSRWS